MNNNPTRQSSILLLADGLRPSELGPYGNTTYDTNAINQLASQSLLFEQCISDTPDIQLGLRGIFTGQHVCDHVARLPDLIDGIGSTGTATVLVTSNTRQFPHCHDRFDRVIEVELPELQNLPTELASTTMAVFFAVVVDAIRSIDEPCCLVVDCPGFVTQWDAPFSLREQLSDEDDPHPSQNIKAPNLQFNAAIDDPDLLLDFQISYGAQVLLLNQLLEIALAEIEKSSWARDALFALTSTRAYPLGEHSVVGFYRPLLYNESLHVPMLIRWPGKLSITGRSQQLIQPGSLYSLLQNWHHVENGMNDKNTNTSFPDIDPHLVLGEKNKSAVISYFNVDGSKNYSIQTHAWKYLSDPLRQLFVKPDDVWEFNQVAARCPDLVDLLQQQLELGLQALAQGKRYDFCLVDELAFGIE